MDKSYKILFKFESNPKIFVSEVPSKRMIDSGLEKASKQRWKEIKMEADKTNKKLWDGDIYRLESFTAQDDNLQINFSVIPFSIRMGMNSLSDYIGKLDENYRPKALYTSCFVITSDKKYLFIEKSKNYYSNKKIAFIGGVLSKTENLILSGEDLFESVKNEIIEEIDVTGEVVEKMDFIAGYESENFNVCLVFKANLNKSFFEISKQFKEEANSEAAKIIGINQSELSQFARTMSVNELPKFEICGYLEQE